MDQLGLVLILWKPFHQFNSGPKDEFVPDEILETLNEHNLVAPEISLHATYGVNRPIVSPFHPPDF
jgi:hypothetical protein